MSAAMVAAVRGYLGRGYAPIPVPPGSKNPNRRGWTKEVVTPDDAPRLWAGGENVGILLGARSGNLVDVDLDCLEACQAAEAFLDETGAIFGRPGKPRSHWLYVADPCVQTKPYDDPVRATHPDEAMRKDARLLELRSTGAQTIFPPSRHSGEDVRWESPGAPAIVHGEYLQQCVDTLAAAALLIRYWPGPESHARHTFSLALAGGMLRAGWAPEDTERFIGTVATLAGDEEARARMANVRTTAERLASDGKATGIPTLAGLLDERIVTKLVEWLGVADTPSLVILPGDSGYSGYSAGTPSRMRAHARARASQNSQNSQNEEDDDPEGFNSPQVDIKEWGEPLPFLAVDVPAFPLGALPSWLGAFVGQLATALQVPADVPAMVALAALSTACAKRIKVLVRDGWEEPVNLYTVVALPPGERKTAVYQTIVEPIFERQSELAKQSGSQIAEAESRRKVIEVTLGRLQQEAAKAEGRVRDAKIADAAEVARDLAATVVPSAPRLLAEDSTPERLTSLMAEHGGRIAALSDEGDLFDLMAGRYSSNGAPNFSIYLKAHSGSDYLVDRVGRPSEHIVEPALTLGLTVQPEVIAGLSSKPGFRGRGLLARFLFAMPVSHIGRRLDNPAAVEPLVRDVYRQCMRRLLMLEGACHWLQLTPEAQAAFAAFRIWLEPQLADGGEFASIRDWSGKLAGAIARIAGLLHMASWGDESMPWDVPIASETMAAAIQIGHYLIGHARAAFALMGADQEVELAKRVLAAIRRNIRDWRARAGKPVFSKRDVYRVIGGLVQKVEALDAPLQLLTEHGYIRQHPPPARQGAGRKPSPLYEAHPSLCVEEEPW